MVHNKTDLVHYNYPSDVDIIVDTYTDWYELYPIKGQLSYTSVHIEFITGEYSGIKYMEICKYQRGHYLGCKKEYIKSKYENTTA